MINISNQQLEQILSYPKLIETLREAFQADYTVPMRHHHDYENPKEKKDSTLLLMPAWEAGKYLGIKIVTVSPNNGKYNLPAIHGTYLLFDAHKGINLAMMDAKLLTVKRTAATSAMASGFLSDKKSKCLLMIGTGVLAPELIRAHTTIRPIVKVYIWGRSFENARRICNQLKSIAGHIEPVPSIESVIKEADIISCATLSETPLIFGNQLRPGQHIDLVGSYKPNMREADDEVILRSSVFVDTYEGACTESGDILIPLQKGILKKKDIRADLFELCSNKKKGRISSQEITCFKSVGHALEDLAAAKMVYEAIPL